MAIFPVRRREGTESGRFATGLDLALFFFLALAGLFGLWLTRSERSQVDQVTIKWWDGREEQINLGVDQQFTLSGKLGPVVVAVNSGQVEIVQSACPEQICVHSGPLPERTRVLICLPNGIIIQAKKGGADYDALTW